MDVDTSDERTTLPFLPQHGQALMPRLKVDDAIRCCGETKNYNESVSVGRTVRAVYSHRSTGSHGAESNCVNQRSLDARAPSGLGLSH